MRLQFLPQFHKNSKKISVQISYFSSIKFVNVCKAIALNDGKDAVNEQSHT